MTNSDCLKVTAVNIASELSGSDNDLDKYRYQNMPFLVKFPIYYFNVAKNIKVKVKLQDEHANEQI